MPDSGTSRSVPTLHRSRLGGDRGEVPVVLIIFATVLLTFYGAIHVSLVFHGRSVVAAAAQDGLRAAQLEGGTEADGRDAAEAVLALSPGLQDTKVEVSAGDDGVTVKVTAKVSTPLFDLLTDVSAEVTGPKERFYSEDERK